MIRMMWLNLYSNKTIAKIGKKNNNEIVTNVDKLEYNNNKCYVYVCVCVIKFHEYIVNDLSFVSRENCQMDKKIAIKRLSRTST